MSADERMPLPLLYSGALRSIDFDWRRRVMSRLLNTIVWAAIALMAGIPLSGHAQTAPLPLPLRIGAANATDHAAAFIGVERGIFARHGLDAKIVMYQT